MNIIVTNANSYKAVVVTTFIKQHYENIKIIGLVKKYGGKIFHSRFYDEVICPSSQMTESSFLSEIKEIIQQKKIDIIIPVDSKEIGAWLKLKPELPKVLDYYSSYKTFDKLNDKLLFSKLCKKLNIPIPNTYYPDEIDSIPKEVEYVFKPTKLASSKGVKYFKDLGELKNYCKFYHSKDFVIQEYYRGKGGGISFFAKDGKIKDFYLHRRILEYPISGGSSTMRGEMDSDFKDQIIKDSRKLVESLNWSGFCMLELKYNEKGYVFIEANPRIWGSVKQGLINGTNYFDDLFGKIKGEKSFEEKYTYQSPLVFLSVLGYLFKGNFQKASKVFSLLNSEADVKLFKDPKGYIGQFFV
jgi:predicted ATP-grasp superfamily ATP-dependent carboligase